MSATQPQSPWFIPPVNQLRLPTLDEVRVLIASRPSNVSLEDVAKGANVELPWLKTLVIGRFENPGYSRVRQVHEFLLSIKRSE